MSAIKKEKLIFHKYPKYFCLDRQTAENFLCNPIHSVPTFSGQYAIVFQSKEGAINSMKPMAKKALKNSHSFRFIVFGFYFPVIEPIWVEEQNDGLFGGKIFLDDMVKAKNSISIKDFVYAEAWRFKENENEELEFEEDYRIVEVDEDTFFAD